MSAERTYAERVAGSRIVQLAVLPESEHCASALFALTADGGIFRLFAPDRPLLDIEPDSWHLLDGPIERDEDDEEGDA